MTHKKLKESFSKRNFTKIVDSHFKDYRYRQNRNSAIINSFKLIYKLPDSG